MVGEDATSIVRGGARPSAGRPSALTLALTGLAAVTVAAVHRWHTGINVLVLSEGMAFIAAGLVARRLRPDSRFGGLLLVGGFLLWMPTESDRISPLLFTLTNPFQSAGHGVIMYMVLTFPRGRLGSRPERAVFALMIVTLLWRNVLWMPFYDPLAFGCPTCPEDMNLLLVRSMPRVIEATERVKPALQAAMELSIAAAIAMRWLRSSVPGRRVLGPMLLPAICLLAADAIAASISFYILGLGFPWTPSPTLGLVLRIVVTSAVFALPAGIVAGLVRARLRHARVSRLVVELGSLPVSSGLEDALARALGDPSLRLALWDPVGRRYVRDGVEVMTPGGEATQAATLLERDGEPLALMVHDEALLDEPGLVEATAVATRLAVENERLQAEIRAQLEEVSASRARIVAAQDDERRRIERDLHDGAQQRLLRLSMALQVAEASLSAQADPALRTSLEVAAEELQAALRELRELARGIHPAVLTQRGLGAALRSLAERAPLPVTVEAVPGERMPAAVEAAAYYVVAESLTNTAKHAAATRVVVNVRVRDRSLEIVVADDGNGGAAFEAGGGLRGLADRVHALGGELILERGEDGGTRVVAGIPLGATLPESAGASVALEPGGP